MRLLWSPRMPGSGNPSTHCFGKRYWIGMGKRWTCRKSDNNLVNGHLSLVNGPITNDQRLLWLVAFDLILRYDYPAAHVNLRPPEALAHEPASRPFGTHDPPRQRAAGDSGSHCPADTCVPDGPGAPGLDWPAGPSARQCAPGRDMANLHFSHHPANWKSHLRGVFLVSLLPDGNRA